MTKSYFKMQSRHLPPKEHNVTDKGRSINLIPWRMANRMEKNASLTFWKI